MLKKLEQLYGREAGEVGNRINDLVRTYQEKLGKIPVRQLSEKDSILITYADSIIHEEEKTLQTLSNFLKGYVGEAMTGVHILPFFPYSSDDGFSVVDYLSVKEEFGDWSDLSNLGQDYDLMFDAVINHISQYSLWYEGFKKGDPAYKDFFILCDPEKDYSQVVRPRALPLLTPTNIEGEEAYVWTTFSDDQIDLNYANPEVFLKITEVLLTYVSHGAKLIRLDAIGFAWKELGTTCIHLPQTHLLIQLMREVLVSVKEDLVIITETNVPHKENIRYFGDGDNEAHMVYQFPLPPLTLHALLTGDGSKLMDWVANLDGNGEETTFFNFLASHDGVGLRPVEGILEVKDIEVMLASVNRNGGRVNYKNNSDGSKSPYEMNINYMDALRMAEDSDDLHIRRFLAAQGILYSMVGVPGVYIHSLLGSGNDIEGMESSGINRRINRKKLDYTQLVTELNSQGRRQAVLTGNKALLTARSKSSAFSPFGEQEVIKEQPGLFSIRRFSPDGRASVLVIINLTDRLLATEMTVSGVDLLTERQFDEEIVLLEPYDVLWIQE